MIPEYMHRYKVETYYNYTPSPNTEWFDIEEDATLWAEEQEDCENVQEVHVYELINLLRDKYEEPKK